MELNDLLRDSCLDFENAAERNDEDLFGLTFVLDEWISGAEALRGRIVCCSHVGVVDCGVVIGVGGGVNGGLIELSKSEGSEGCKARGLEGGVDRAIDEMTAGLEVFILRLGFGSPLLSPDCIFLDFVFTEKKPIWRDPSRQVAI